MRGFMICLGKKPIQPRRCLMEGLYAGSDLHGNNNLVGIVDEQGKRIFKKRLPKEPQMILKVLVVPR
jgi:hypothetical protein